MSNIWEMEGGLGGQGNVEGGAFNTCDIYLRWEGKLMGPDTSINVKYPLNLGGGYEYTIYTIHQCQQSINTCTFYVEGKTLT